MASIDMSLYAATHNLTTSRCMSHHPSVHVAPSLGACRTIPRCMSHHITVPCHHDSIDVSQVSHETPETPPERRDTQNDPNGPNFKSARAILLLGTTGRSTRTVDHKRRGRPAVGDLDHPMRLDIFHL